MRLSDLRVVATENYRRICADGVELDDQIDGIFEYTQRLFSSAENRRRLGPYLSALSASDFEHMYALARWTQFGFPTFHLTGDAFGAAILTDCRALKLEDLKLPYPAFILQLPHPNPLKTVCSDGRLAEVTTLLVSEYRVQVDPKTQLPQIRSRRHRSGAATRNFSIIGSTAEGTDATIFTRAQATQNSVADWLANTANNEGDAVITPVDSQALAASVRIAVNSMVHINSLRARGPWVPDGKRKKGVPQSLNWTVPGPIKLSPELRAAAFNLDCESSPWKLAHRFVVRGHWRNQPCGPGSLERKLTWVAPYWKGPDDTTVLERTYHVE